MTNRSIKLVVIHCSDSPDSMDIGVDEIRSWHLERGFSDVGYHRVVRRDGRVERGRADNRIGAHVAGHNKNSIGICWVGRTRMTEAQRKATVECIGNYLLKYKLTTKQVVGHRELAPMAGKTCPNLDMDALRADVAEWIRIQGVH
jgi:N-acetylmuramoyl-L-alanine amidase